MLKNLRVTLVKKLIDINEFLIFERKLKKYYLANCTIETVIDVGSNKGQSIDFFLKINKNCKIYAIEPNPDLFQLLKLKYQKNSNVLLFNIGISNVNGQKIFFENIFDYTSTFEELNFDSEYLSKKAQVLGVKKEDIIKKQYPVITQTLSKFISENVIEQTIDILKIDTEGHEYYCLEGLFIQPLNKKINVIQIEDHNDDMYAKKIEFSKINSLLNQNDFFEIKKIRHGFGDFNEVIFSKKY